MKKLLLILAIATPGVASADGYVIGAGRWTCADVIASKDDISRYAQMAGWVFGYWSAATFSRESAFVDTVENVGGNAILDATVTECSKAPSDTPLYRVVQQMITNTN